MRTPVIFDPPGETGTPAPRSEAAPTVIEVRDVEKTFRIPDQRIDSIKERVTHPLTRIEYRDLHALKSVSFDVARGEFFGIVGRNGSGKSTLLKILASIYRADSGPRAHGRPGRPLHRARRRLQPRAHCARERRPQRRPDGTQSPRGPAPPRLGDRLRRAPRVQRPEAEELLLGDDGPARVRGHGPGRGRHHADRRGAGSRRRGVRAEVHGLLPRAAAGRQDDRARHPRHGDRPAPLPPGDGPARGRHAVHRLARGGRPALLPTQLRRAGRRGGQQPRRARGRARRERAPGRGDAARPRGQVDRERRAGAADHGRVRGRGGARPRRAGVRVPRPERGRGGDRRVPARGRQPAAHR